MTTELIIAGVALVIIVVVDYLNWTRRVRKLTDQNDDMRMTISMAAQELRDAQESVKPTEDMTSPQQFLHAQRCAWVHVANAVVLLEGDEER